MPLRLGHGCPLCVRCGKSVRSETVSCLRGWVGSSPLVPFPHQPPSNRSPALPDWKPETGKRDRGTGTTGNRQAGGPDPPVGGGSVYIYYLHGNFTGKPQAGRGFPALPETHTQAFRTSRRDTQVPPRPPGHPQYVREHPGSAGQKGPDKPLVLPDGLAGFCPPNL